MNLLRRKPVKKIRLLVILCCTLFGGCAAMHARPPQDHTGVTTAYVVHDRAGLGLIRAIGFQGKTILQFVDATAPGLKILKSSGRELEFKRIGTHYVALQGLYHKLQVLVLDRPGTSIVIDPQISGIVMPHKKAPEKSSGSATAKSPASAKPRSTLREATHVGTKPLFWELHPPISMASLPQQRAPSASRIAKSFPSARGNNPASDDHSRDSKVKKKVFPMASHKTAVTRVRDIRVGHHRAFTSLVFDMAGTDPSRIDRQPDGDLVIGYHQLECRFCACPTAPSLQHYVSRVIVQKKCIKIFVRPHTAAHSFCLGDSPSRPNRYKLVVDFSAQGGAGTAGSAAPAKKPKRVTAKMHEAQPQRWILHANKPIEEQLTQWSKKAGWVLLWGPGDWLIPNTTSFSGDYRKALADVVKSLSVSGLNVHLTLYSNNVASVTGN